MKKSTHASRACFALKTPLSLAFLACGSMGALGQNTTWVSGVANWSSAPSWTAGVPQITTPDAFVDNGGTAQITGAATSKFLRLGTDAGRSGTLEVRAGGSASFTSIIVGGKFGGTGVLKVMEGGYLSSYGGPIGSDFQGVGTATVDGANSRWDMGGEALIGVNGAGVLNLTNGGTLSVANGAGQVGIADHEVSSGTLNIGLGGAPGFLNAADVHGHDGSATVVFNHTASAYVFSPKLLDNLSVQHTGPGRTLLNAISNFFGETRVTAGELVVQGRLEGTGAVAVTAGGTLGGNGFIAGATTIQGTLAPGIDVGLLTFGGDLSLQSSGRVRMQLGGTLRGTSFDAVNVSGQLLYGGTLNVDLINGYEPRLGEAFKVFGGYTSHGGTFSDVVFSVPYIDGTFDPASGSVTVTSVPEPHVAGMLGLGLATMGLRRFRRRDRQVRSHR